MSQIQTQEGEAKKLQFLWDELEELLKNISSIKVKVNEAIQSMPSANRPSFVMPALDSTQKQLRVYRRDLNEWMQANQKPKTYELTEDDMDCVLNRISLQYKKDFSYTRNCKLEYMDPEFDEQHVFSDYVHTNRKKHINMTGQLMRIWAVKYSEQVPRGIAIGIAAEIAEKPRDFHNWYQVLTKFNLIEQFIEPSVRTDKYKMTMAMILQFRHLLGEL